MLSGFSSVQRRATLFCIRVHVTPSHLTLPVATHHITLSHSIHRAQVVEFWNSAPEDGHIYFVMRPPWVRPDRVESFFTMFPLVGFAPGQRILSSSRSEDPLKPGQRILSSSRSEDPLKLQVRGSRSEDPLKLTRAYTHCM